MKQVESNQVETLSQEELEIIKSLLNYPSLEQLFDSSDSRNLTMMKQKMKSTVEDLNRIIRHGTKADAEKAMKASEAYLTSLDFLTELEKKRQTPSF